MLGPAIRLHQPRPGSLLMSLWSGAIFAPTWYVTRQRSEWFLSHWRKVTATGCGGPASPRELSQGGAGCNPAHPAAAHGPPATDAGAGGAAHARLSGFLQARPGLHGVPRATWPAVRLLGPERTLSCPQAPRPSSASGLPCPPGPSARKRRTESPSPGPAGTWGQLAQKTRGQ